MNSFYLIFGILFLITANDAKAVTKSDICENILEKELIEEIWSYENIRDEILQYVIEGEFKGKTYDELAKFVDKFGARPSGSEVLEKSIDYMIQLTKDEVINDITTEELEMKAWTAHEQDATLSCCRTLHVKHAAYVSALYTLNISILVVLLYSWRIGINAKRFKELDDVYYGVQIAYFAIIGTQMFMIVLSIFLFYGIYKENVAFLVPWVVGCMTFMALEAMAMVYSNILRDHVNKQFDSMCKAEISFLIPRIILNCVSIWCVLRLYHLLRAGVTWKGAAAIEL